MLRFISLHFLFFFGLSSVIAAQTWNFGSGPGRDGDGGFHLRAVDENEAAVEGEFQVVGEGLRFFRAGGSPAIYRDVAALISVPTLGGTFRNDFTIILEGRINRIGGDWNRFGLIAFSDGRFGSPGHYEDSGTFYNVRFHRPGYGSHQRFRLSRVLGNPLGESADATPDFSIGAGAFRITLQGVYDNRQRLKLTANIWHESGPMEGIDIESTLQNQPLTGTFFGLGGRLRVTGAQPTDILFTRFSVLVDD